MQGTKSVNNTYDKHADDGGVARIMFYIGRNKKRALVARCEKLGQSMTTYINRMIDADNERWKRSKVGKG